MAISVPTASVIFDTIVPYYLSQAIGLLTNGVYDKFNDQLFMIGVIVLIGFSMNLLAYQMALLHESKVRNGIAHNVLRDLLKKDQGFFANQKIGSLTGKYIDFINGHVALQSLMVGEIISFIINIFLSIILLILLKLIKILIIILK